MSCEGDRERASRSLITSEYFMPCRSDKTAEYITKLASAMMQAFHINVLMLQTQNLITSEYFMPCRMAKTAQYLTISLFHYLTISLSIERSLITSEYFMPVASRRKLHNISTYHYLTISLSHYLIINREITDNI